MKGGGLLSTGTDLFFDEDLRHFRAIFDGTSISAAKTKVHRRDRVRTRTGGETRNDVVSTNLRCLMCCTRDSILVGGQQSRNRVELSFHCANMRTVSATMPQNTGIVGSPVMSPALGSYLPAHEQDIQQQDNMSYMNGHAIEPVRYASDSLGGGMDQRPCCCVSLTSPRSLSSFRMAFCRPDVNFVEFRPVKKRARRSSSTQLVSLALN